MTRTLAISLAALLLVALYGCAARPVPADVLDHRFAAAPETQRLARAAYWYRWQGYDRRLGREQVYNLLALDPGRAPLRVDFAWFNESDDRATLSEVADTSLAVAAINSAYFERLDSGGYVSYHRSDGQTQQWVELPPAHLRYWKHGAALARDADGRYRIFPGNLAVYDSLPYPDLLSSAPLLISDGVPVGRYFVDGRRPNRRDLPGEHPDRHQYGVAPRAAVGTTPAGMLLLITVDGRAAGRAEGINAAELTDLLLELGADDALNLDGGGSVTSFVRGQGTTGIVNYPSDLRKSAPTSFAHRGQRRIGMALLLVPTRPRLRDKMRRLSVARDPDARDYRDNANIN